MNEILPGVFHWTVIWPDGGPLESYLIRSDLGSVLVDQIADTDRVLGIILALWIHERSYGFAPARVFARSRTIHFLKPVSEFVVHEEQSDLPMGISPVHVSGRHDGEFALHLDRRGQIPIVGDGLGTAGKWTPNGGPVGVEI